MVGLPLTAFKYIMEVPLRWHTDLSIDCHTSLALYAWPMFNISYVTRNLSNMAP